MSAIVLSDEQQQAYDSIGTYTTLFLQGSAGCGKSVVITNFIKNDTDNKFILCAMTNKAAKVLTEKLNTGVQIPTIHSVLGMQPCDDGTTKIGDEITEFKFTVQARNNVSLATKSIIVDEASMMCRDMQNYIFDMISFGNLRSCTFVGDKYQLPCVKGDTFQYDRIEHTITLQKVQRAKGDLQEYYNEIRYCVDTEEPFPFYKNATIFDSIEDFTSYFKNYDGSKIVITYTNKNADQFSKLVDSHKPYIGQTATALSQCQYKHLELTDFISVNTNSVIKIQNIFNSYSHMKRDALNDDYEHKLPNLPINLTIEQISYLKIVNDRNEIIYVATWNGTEKDKETLLLNYFNRTYRELQNTAKKYIALSEWKKKAKDDGYLKKLGDLNSFQYLPSHIRQQDKEFWNNFYAIKQALILRSIYVSTAHRAQGITVDLAAIDINDLEKSNSDKLIYVALTRAATNIIYFRG